MTEDGCDELRIECNKSSFLWQGGDGERRTANEGGWRTGSREERDTEERNTEGGIWTVARVLIAFRAGLEVESGYMIRRQWLTQRGGTGPRKCMMRGDDEVGSTGKVYV